MRNVFYFYSHTLAIGSRQALHQACSDSANRRWGGRMGRKSALSAGKERDVINLGGETKKKGEM